MTELIAAVEEHLELEALTEINHTYDMGYGLVAVAAIGAHESGTSYVRPMFQIVYDLISRRTQSTRIAPCECDHLAYSKPCRAHAA